MMLVRSTCLLAFLAHLAATVDGGKKEKVHSDIDLKMGGKNGGITPQIIEGTEAEIGEYPYYVHMQIFSGPSTYSCGGTLIAPQVIMSAAHCNDPLLETNLEFGYVGATVFWSTENGAVLGECDKWVNHPDFVPIEYLFNGAIKPGTSVLAGNDFALCLLKEPVDIDTSSVMLKLNDDPFFPPDSATTVTEACGMGRTSGDRSEGTEVLLRADLSLLPQDDCFDRYPDYIDDTMICTFDEYDDPLSGVCSGDSGGPIVVSSMEDGKTIHRQVGITSWGNGLCGSAPDVYARVSTGMPWIRSTVCDEWGLRDSEFCIPFTCPNGESVFTVTVTTDDTPEQNDWILLTDTGLEVASESLDLPDTEYHTELCLQPGSYSWDMGDDGGDGMPDGSVVVTLNNEVLVNGFTEGPFIGIVFEAPDDLTNNPTASPTPERSSAPTSAPTEFDCDSNQILTVTVETDAFPLETSWVLEKYENDVWTVVDSKDFLASFTLHTDIICLDESSVYRYSIFDTYGDGLCSFFGICGFFEVTLNGNLIAEGVRFGSQDVTVFNTCVDQPGTFSVSNNGNVQSGTCGDLAGFLSTRSSTIGGIACRKDNLDGPGRIRDQCPSTCGLYGEGVCASP